MAAGRNITCAKAGIDTSHLEVMEKGVPGFTPVLPIVPASDLETQIDPIRHAIRLPTPENRFAEQWNFYTDGSASVN